VLQIGAGRDERLGMTLDINPSVSPDILHDLQVMPYPIADSSFDAVYAFSILEHVRDVLGVMTELHRILVPGGFAAVLVPHFASYSAFTDPTHRAGLSVQSFDYLVDGTVFGTQYGFYSKARFKKRMVHLDLARGWGKIPLVRRAANRWPVFYEEHLCFIVRPAGVYLELEAVK
jgi:SAM-dependent methyltransferase